MKAITINLYTFNELPTEKAKERARDWWRKVSSGDRPEAALANIEAAAGFLGITIDRDTWHNTDGRQGTEPAIYWALYTQGAGASFRGSYRYERGSQKVIRADYPSDVELHAIADRLYEAQRRCFFRLSAKVEPGSSHYVHEMAAQVEVYGAPENWRAGSEDPAFIVESALRDFMRWIHKQIQQEDEFTSSDEYIAEELEANEYTFTASGERFEP